jgi:hypothetical protein
MEEEICKNCEFFKPIEAEKEKGLGLCLRLPPVPMQVPGAKIGDMPVVAGNWPPVGSDRWCGEFKMHRHGSQD